MKLGTAFLVNNSQSLRFQLNSQLEFFFFLIFLSLVMFIQKINKNKHKFCGKSDGELTCQVLKDIIKLQTFKIW